MVKSIDYKDWKTTQSPSDLLALVFLLKHLNNKHGASSISVKISLT